jgi:hypothetical protein
MMTATDPSQQIAHSYQQACPGNVTLDLALSVKAVLSAANGASSYGPDDVLNDAPRIASAVLREAASQIWSAGKTEKEHVKGFLYRLAWEIEDQGNPAPTTWLVDLKLLHDPDFSGGLTAAEHVAVLRGGPDPRKNRQPDTATETPPNSCKL